MFLIALSAFPGTAHPPLQGHHGLLGITAQCSWDRNTGFERSSCQSSTPGYRAACGENHSPGLGSPRKLPRQTSELPLWHQTGRNVKQSNEVYSCACSGLISWVICVTNNQKLRTHQDAHLRPHILQTDAISWTAAAIRKERPWYTVRCTPWTCFSLCMIYYLHVPLKKKINIFFLFWNPWWGWINKLL